MLKSRLSPVWSNRHSQRLAQTGVGLNGAGRTGGYVARRGIRKHYKAALIILLSPGSFVYGLHLLSLHQWTDAPVFLSVGVLIPCWLVAMMAPSKCGVKTQKGHPCPNDAQGVIFGCGKARDHTWKKFFARIGWDKNLLTLPVVEPDQQPQRELIQSATTNQPVSVRIESDGKAKIVFWATMISTVCTVASTFVAVL